METQGERSHPELKTRKGASVGFSWEFEVGAGILLALIAAMNLLGRRPSRGVSRSAHEWLVLRDRIEQLENRVRALESTPSRPVAEPGPPPPVQVPVPGRLGVRPHSNVAGPKEAVNELPARKAPIQPLPTLIAVPDLREQVADQAHAVPVADPGMIAMDEFGPQYEKVCELAGMGRKPAAIAQEVGLPLERVEMILGLYQLWANPRSQPHHEPAQHVQAID